MASNLEFMSDFVVMGISYSWTSKIFYTDLREANKINYFETERLGNHTLSCNQTNSNEFVLATELNVKIYDIRQTRPLYQIYEVDHSRADLMFTDVHASWSPNGKYIFTSDYQANTFFFWDALKAERISIPREIADLVKWNEEKTWIDDYLVVKTSDDVYALAPHASTMEAIDQSGNYSIPLVIGDPPCYAGFPLAYNEKTLQLAGLVEEGICIWSHYKLPPYAMQQS